VIWREALDAAGAAPDPRDPSIMQHSRMDTETKVEALLREAGFTTVQTEARRVEHRFTAEDLLTVQLRCGVASRRLRSLGADDQARCRARAEERIRNLSEEELVYRPEVILGVACR
jgi:hypothetical protein